MERLNNYRMFEVKYLGATNSNSSRVKINDLRFNKSKTISYDHKFTNIFEMAQEYLLNIGIELTGMGESKEGYLLFTRDFETQINK